MDHDVISANDFAGEVCIGLQQVIAGQQRQGMGSSALLPLSLPIVNYDAPPATYAGNSTSCLLFKKTFVNYSVILI